MKLAGHTMGTPDLGLRGSIELFASIGFDGIEIRCAPDGQIDPESTVPADLDDARATLERTGLSVVCLTPYNRDFVTEARSAELAALRRVVDLATALECRLVRLYGGTDPVPEGVSTNEAWDLTVSGIRELADYAAAGNVGFCVETHIGSLTFHAADAVRMVRDVDRDNVGILLDFAWVHLAGRETATQAIDACAPYLVHCHYKDWLIESAGANPAWHARLMGEGTIPWREFFGELVRRGYDGSMSDEYEYYWHPEALPPARIGMQHNLEYVRRCLRGDIP